jgi:hypothetical protein
MDNQHYKFNPFWNPVRLIIDIIVILCVRTVLNPGSLTAVFGALESSERKGGICRLVTFHGDEWSYLFGDWCYWTIFTTWR